ncbi:MAG: translation initiation factor IF-3 [Bdellovibrionaceae bacterium]|nr:translation initiation factor IF-3 [Pseudobdellovibrionaceae bacterium]|tara:strand:- start:1667 stop:2239 length:573 start_codon:yes stop_codon:yes gene_type:complete
MAFPSPGGRKRGRFQPQTNDKHRINERIRVPQVRLIDDVGNQVGIVDTKKAYFMAKDKGLDLVEVSPNSKPPVCKILDYGKFKYEQKKKEQLAKKNQVTIKVKEVQMRPNTDSHDLDYKFKNVKGFLEAGDKAKVTMMFRGRQITNTEVGHELMARLAEHVESVGHVESAAKMEGRKMIMVLAPGPKKKS